LGGKTFFVTTTMSVAADSRTATTAGLQDEKNLPVIFVPSFFLPTPSLFRQAAMPLERALMCVRACA